MNNNTNNALVMAQWMNKFPTPNQYATVRNMNILATHYPYTTVRNMSRIPNPYQYATVTQINKRHMDKITIIKNSESYKELHNECTKIIEGIKKKRIIPKNLPISTILKMRSILISVLSFCKYLMKTFYNDDSLNKNQKGKRKRKKDQMDQLDYQDKLHRIFLYKVKDILNKIEKNQIPTFKMVNDAINEIRQFNTYEMKYDTMNGRI